MSSDLSHRLAIAASVVLIYVPGPPVALAQGISKWDTDMHSAARLIAGVPQNSADAVVLRAGVQIRLDPGWHTYWRYPGDSGAPPNFDFSGSENVKAATVLWPAPQRFPDGAGGHSVGYLGELILPLRIVPKDAAKPSSLRLKLDYDVCAAICIPARASLVLPLSGGIGANDNMLRAAEARVPRRVALGADNGLAIRSIRREPGGTHGRVVVEVAAPDDAPVDLFAEGPTPDWSLPLPEPSPVVSAATQATRRFVFDLDGVPPGANAEGAPLTFTVVSPNDAIEVVSPLR